VKTRASRTGEFASLMRVCARARVIFAARERARARRIISPFVSSRIHGATRARDDAMTMNDDYDSPPIVVADASWRPLRGMTRAELRLRHTLPTGQSFRWRSRGDEGSDYVGVVGRRVVRARERRDGDDGVVEYKVYCRPSNETVEDDERVIREYFNADVELKALYETFSKADGRFRALASRIDGARTLRQDPSECLFSFICSSNNHISRIHGMVGKMCSRYGDALPVTMDDVARDDVVKIEAAAEEETPTTTFHAFPSVAQVIERATEEELRALGFGYRAKFIVGAAETLARVARELETTPDAYLRRLRDETPYLDAHAALLALPGVGPKVSACVCLFSLDKHQAIPVDTHVWQFAVEHYAPELRDAKSVTPKIMRAVERRMEDVFGPYAGWAHNALFIAELSDVRKTLPEHLRTPKRTPTKTPKTKTPKTKTTTKRKIVDTVVDADPDDDDEPFESPSKPFTRDDG
jgi:N-glycosylase/DNA lyase